MSFFTEDAFSSHTLFVHRTKYSPAMKVIAILFLISPFKTKADDSDTNFHKRCNIWPRGWPTEHHDKSCNRAVQNSLLKSGYDMTDYLTIQTYFNLPEEKTWACPLEDSSTDDEMPMQNSFDYKGLVTGMATNWILYNEASTPIIVERVNESPLVGYVDDGMKSAVYPNGRSRLMKLRDYDFMLIYSIK